METIAFILTTLSIGILCSIPGVVVGRVLSAKGITRTKPIEVIGLTIGFLFLWRLVVPQAPLGLQIVFGILFSTIGVYRSDWWATYQRGRRWWLKGSTKGDPTSNLIVGVIITVCIAVVVWVLVMYPRH